MALLVADEESICQRNETKQVLGAGGHVRLASSPASGEIGPFGRDHRLASVGQDDDELEFVVPMRALHHLERLVFKRVTQSRDGYALRKVADVGSVWTVPSIESITTN
jgi:hypothetical protein